MIFYNLFAKLDLISKFYPKIMIWRNFNLPWFSLNILWYKISTPPPSIIVTPPYPWGSYFKQTWIFSTWRCFHMSSSFSGRSLSEKKVVLYIYFYVEIRPSPPNVAPTLHRISWFEQTWICFTCECHCIIFRF